MPGVLANNTSSIADNKNASTRATKEEKYDDLSVIAVGNQWAKSLTKEQYYAIHEYTDTAYSNINASLRGKGNFLPGNLEKATEIHMALQDAKIPRSCTVYRGVTSDALGYLQNLTDEEMVGHVIRDGGFMSTTLKRESAFCGSVQLEIDVPAGARGAFIGSISCYPDEDEVLFDAQRCLVITGVRRGQYGERIISARMLT